MLGAGVIIENVVGEPEPCSPIAEVGLDVGAALSISLGVDGMNSPSVGEEEGEKEGEAVPAAVGAGAVVP